MLTITMMVMIAIVAGMLKTDMKKVLGIVLILLFTITLTNNLQSLLIVNGTVPAEFYLKSKCDESLL